MSFDVAFVVLREGVTTGETQEALERNNENDDGLDYVEVLAPFLDAQVPEAELRARIEHAALEVLVTSPFIEFREGHMYAKAPPARRAQWIASQMLEYQGGPGWVPASISFAGDVREFVRVIALMLTMLEGVCLCDPQTLQVLDADEALEWAAP
ncbi:MAG: hypothetical protein IT384_21210 [Deltaproteobacteria bacterium]|nr:hypothetical protein [Deltaproteobacteria bacterium]